MRNVLCTTKEIRQFSTGTTPGPLPAVARIQQWPPDGRCAISLSDQPLVLVLSISTVQALRVPVSCGPVALRVSSLHHVQEAGVATGEDPVNTCPGVIFDLVGYSKLG
jgi:hypothetical protein